MEGSAAYAQPARDRPTGQLEGSMNNLESQLERYFNLCNRMDGYLNRLRGVQGPPPPGLAPQPKTTVEPVRPLLERFSRAVDALGAVNARFDNTISELDGLI